MSTPKRLESYPEEFTTIAKRIEGEKKPIVLKFNSMEDALKCRRMIYGFKSALEHTGNEVYPRFMMTELKIGQDATLTITCRADTDYAEIMRKALDASKEEEK